MGGEGACSPLPSPRQGSAGNLVGGSWEGGGVKEGGRGRAGPLPAPSPLSDAPRPQGACAAPVYQGLVHSGWVPRGWGGCRGWGGEERSGWEGEGTGWGQRGAERIKQKEEQ